MRYAQKRLLAVAALMMACLSLPAAAGEPLDGRALFIACLGCHTLHAGEPHTVGPNLYGMMGEPAATRPGYVYSDALKNKGISWTRMRLKGFIMATERAVPGTWMAYEDIIESSELNALVDYIIRETAPAAGEDP